MAITCKVCNDSGCCPTCEGRGAMPAPDSSRQMPCSTCFGSGKCPACAEACDQPSEYKRSASA